MYIYAPGIPYVNPGIVQVTFVSFFGCWVRKILYYNQVKSLRKWRS